MGKTRFLNKKLAELRNSLRRHGGLAVAFSGGLDSAFLLKVAREELGGQVLALVARGVVFPESELQEALDLANRIGVRIRVVEVDILGIPNFADNPPDRCYHCKRALFGRLLEVAREEGLPVVADGANADDLRDYRPGSKATAELGITHPLNEAGLTKAEIRELSRQLGLPTWDKPAAACLASRFPYGDRITEEGLRRVEAAEFFLRSQGFRQVRVRSHGPIARIEVPEPDLNRFAAPDLRGAVVARLKELGFLYVSLDLQGYRMGSLNERLAEKRGE